MNVKINLRRDMAEAIVQLIDGAITQTTVKDIDDTELLLATLSEVSLSLKKKLIEPKKDYNLKLSAAQSIAMHLLYKDYVSQQSDFTNHLANRMHQISQEVSKIYQR